MFNITLQLLNHQCSYLDPTKPLGKKAHRHENRKSFSQLRVDSNTLRQTDSKTKLPKKTKTRPSACGFKQLILKKEGHQTLHRSPLFTDSGFKTLCITFIMNAAKTNDHNYLGGQARTTLASISTIHPQ